MPGSPACAYYTHNFIFYQPGNYNFECNATARVEMKKKTNFMACTPRRPVYKNSQMLCKYWTFSLVFELTHKLDIYAEVECEIAVLTLKLIIWIKN